MIVSVRSLYVVTDKPAFVGMRIASACAVDGTWDGIDAARDTVGFDVVRRPAVELFSVEGQLELDRELIRAAGHGRFRFHFPPLEDE